jgi:hypothetical protein
MARKRVEKMVATEPTTKVVRLELPIESHDQFRIAAAMERTNMATLARRIVEDYLSKRKGSK